MPPMTNELTPDQVAGYLESSCALIEAELKALGDDAAWHQAPDEWCAREVVGHLIEAEKRGFAGRSRIHSGARPSEARGMGSGRRPRNSATTARA